MGGLRPLLGVLVAECLFDEGDSSERSTGESTSESLCFLSPRPERDAGSTVSRSPLSSPTSLIERKRWGGEDVLQEIFCFLVEYSPG